MFAIRDTRDGRLIGLDGGYPWKPTDPRRAELWADKQKAIEYCEAMGWRRSSDLYGALSWEIVEVEPMVVGETHLNFRGYRAVLESPIGGSQTLT